MTQERPTCFIITSYDRSQLDASHTIKRVVSDLGYKPIRMDESGFRGFAPPAILEAIDDAALVIVELTIQSFNVAFELGYALGRDKIVILTRRKVSTPQEGPFDLAGHTMVLYEYFAELEELLRKQVLLNPGDASTWLSTRAEEVEEQRETESEPTLDDRVSRAGNDYQRAEALYERARSHRLRRRLVDAVADLEEAHGLDPANERVVEAICRIFNDMRRYEDAIQMAQTHQEIAPENPAGYAAAAYAHNGLNQYDQAVQNARRALELDPDHAPARRMLEYARRNLAPEPDVVSIPSALVGDPIEYDLEEFIGHIKDLVRYKEYEVALSLTTTRLALERPGETPTLQYTRGRLLSRLREPDRALDAYAEAVKADPHHWQSHREVGSLLMERRMPTQALQNFRRALECAPQDPNILNDIGYQLSRSRDNDYALQAYTRALAEDPDHISVLMNRAFALNLMRRNSEALADYERVLELNPNNPRALIERGITLSFLRRYDEARAAAQKAAEIAPDDPRLSSLVDRLNRH